MKQIRFNSKRIKSTVILETVRTLNRGGIIIYPTETIYGIGGNGLSRSVYDRIDRIKKRKSDKHYLLLVKNITMIRKLGLSLTKTALNLARVFWPGPLTQIVAAGPAAPEVLLNKTGSLAVRISSLPFILKLFAHINFPLISTSCNLSGSDSELDKNGCDLELYCGPLKSRPSTIVDSRFAKPVLIRQGAIPFKKILNEAF
ncbi:MAG: L-threonylcarbamoyladenylate synthase [bacterium]